MNKLNLLLLVALLASSLLLVRTAYEARQVYSALDRAKREHLQLEADHARLAADRQTEATNQKVRRVAAEQLKMTPPVATLYVDAPGTKSGSKGPTGDGGQDATATAALSTRGAR